MTDDGILVVLVAWNGRKWLPRSIDSVLADLSRHDHLIVIDNGSRDDTDDWLKATCGDRIEVITNHWNRGFARACNQGLREAVERGFRATLILNQDTWFAPGFLDALRAVLLRSEEQGIGMVGPVHYGYGENDGLDPAFAAQLREEGIPAERLGDHEWLPTVTQIGAAMLIPVGSVRRIGGFDPVYFAYAEESDFIRRLRFHGLSCGIVTGAILHHHHTKQNVNLPAWLKAHVIKNGYLFPLKDPVPSTGALLWRYLRHDLWRVMRNKGRLGDLRYLLFTILVQGYIMLMLPRTLLVRHRERRGAAHL